MTEAEHRRRGAILIGIARESLERVLRPAAATDAGTSHDEPWLFEPAAVFVTLSRGRKLRGCIGSIEAVRPLIDDLCQNSVAAAQRDPRFDPVTADELDDIEVEVTLLSPMESMTFRSQEDALAQLRPGVDGVLLRFEGRRATYLPQVWETLRSPAEFLASLKQKAGLAPDFWHPEVRLERYATQKWSESEL